MPEGLLESELFGHERGAFTGAVQRKTGLLATANGGTVFLDEIGELSIALQAKLLRVLEQRQMRRVGDSRLIDLDIRVIAATNSELEAAVADGRFREDLFYRLNVVHFELPPLRSRAGDIPILMNAFLEEFALAAHHQPPTVVPAAWAVLERYAWPGNVRELRNVAQRLVVLDDDGQIDDDDLGSALRQLGSPGDSLSPAGPTTYASAQDRAMRQFRRAYVAQMLAAHGGNVSRAAKASGVSRRTFHRWIADTHQTKPGEGA